MAFSFAALRVYDLGYVEVDKTQRSKLSPSEIASIKTAEVIKNPDYRSKEIKCTLQNGGTVYLKLSTKSQFEIGDNVDLSKCTAQELVHPANGDIIHRFIEDSLLDKDEEQK